jgi:hypothetical protein
MSVESGTAATVRDASQGPAPAKRTNRPPAAGSGCLAGYGARARATSLLVLHLLRTHSTKHVLRRVHTAQRHKNIQLGVVIFLFIQCKFI